MAIETRGVLWYIIARNRKGESDVHVKDPAPLTKAGSRGWRCGSKYAGGQRRHRAYLAGDIPMGNRVPEFSVPLTDSAKEENRNQKESEVTNDVGY